jgi:transposase-like protein
VIEIDAIESFISLKIKLRNPRAAQKYLKAIRWRNGVICPYCDCERTWAIKKRGKDAYRCGDCSNSFSDTVSTFFDNTKLPLRTWFAAIWLLWKTPEGVASTSLAKQVKVTQPTAWWMIRRLRAVARADKRNFFDRPLPKEKADSSGVVRGSPFPPGLTFAEIIRRLCEVHPEHNIEMIRQRLWMKENLQCLHRRQ